MSASLTVSDRVTLGDLIQDELGRLKYSSITDYADVDTANVASRAEEFLGIAQTFAQPGSTIIDPNSLSGTKTAIALAFESEKNRKQARRMAFLIMGSVLLVAGAIALWQYMKRSRGGRR